MPCALDAGIPLCPQVASALGSWTLQGPEAAMASPLGHWSRTRSASRSATFSMSRSPERAVALSARSATTGSSTPTAARTAAAVFCPLTDAHHAGEHGCPAGYQQIGRRAHWVGRARHRGDGLRLHSGSRVGPGGSGPSWVRRPPAPPGGSRRPPGGGGPSPLMPRLPRQPRSPRRQGTAIFGCSGSGPGGRLFVTAAGEQPRSPRRCSRRRRTTSATPRCPRG